MRSVAAAALATCAVLAVAPVASASSESQVDGTGDVVVRHRGGPAPATAPFADIVSIRSTHTPTEVVIKTTYVELVSKPSLVMYEGYDVITDDGTTYSGQLIYTEEHGVSSLLLVGEHGTSKACFERALSGHVNRRTATVTFVIPTRCLGHPAWVRTGAGSFVVKRRGAYAEYRDDARAPYRVPDPGGIYLQPTYGPELPVGP